VTHRERRHSSAVGDPELLNNAGSGRVEQRLRDADTNFIAGGSDLIQLMQDWVERPKYLVDIDRLPLDHIEISNDGARIGPCPNERCGRSPRAAAPLSGQIEALLASAWPQIRNIATIGGRLEITTILVEEQDRIVNPAGVEGLGELPIVGAAAAIANAVCHATGVRVRDLPIRLEKLLT
jgi:CO/xanthine dehydrogenase FAD-binding subunit